MFVFSCRTSWRLQRVESGLRLLRRSRPALLCTLSTCNKEGTKWHHITTIVQTNGHQWWLTMRPRSAPKALVFVNCSITNWPGWQKKIINNKSKSHHPKWQLSPTYYCKLPFNITFWKFSPWNSTQFLIWTVRWDQRLSQHSAIKKAFLTAILTMLPCVWLTAWK